MDRVLSGESKERHEKRPEARRVQATINSQGGGGNRMCKGWGGGGGSAPRWLGPVNTLGHLTGECC